MLSYAWLTALGAPVWRATLMLALYLGARLLYRGKSMLNAIGAAALALLIVNPQVLFGASFQLTFLCVWLVAAVGIPILERTTQPFVRGSQKYRFHVLRFCSAGKSGAVPAGFANDRGTAATLCRPPPALAGCWLVAARTLLGVGELLLISVVMQIGLALPMAYYFHRATVVGLPANMLVVPLMELLMPAAVAAMALGYVSHALAKVPGADCRLRTRGYCRHGALAGRTADRRSARAHAGHRRDLVQRTGDRAGHGPGAPPSRGWPQADWRHWPPAHSGFPQSRRVRSFAPRYWR